MLLTLSRNSLSKKTMACNGFSVTFLAADLIWIVKVVCVCGATRAPPPATCHSALFCSLKLVLYIDHRRVGHVGHSRPPRTGRRGQRFGSLFLYTHAMKARGKSLKRGCCRACLPAGRPAGFHVARRVPVPVPSWRYVAAPQPLALSTHFVQ